MTSHCVCFSTACLPIGKDSDWIASESSFKKLIYIQLMIKFALSSLLSDHIVESKILLRLTIPIIDIFILLQKLTSLLIVDFDNACVSSRELHIVERTQSDCHLYTFSRPRRLLILIWKLWLWRLLRLEVLIIDLWLGRHSNVTIIIRLIEKINHHQVHFDEKSSRLLVTVWRNELYLQLA